MWCPLATALLYLASGAGGLVPSARHPSPRAPARLSRLFDAASVAVIPSDTARNGTAAKAKDAGPKFLFSPPMTLAKYDTMRKKRVRDAAPRGSAESSANRGRRRARAPPPRVSKAAPRGPGPRNRRCAS
jgi:hypothetical protein